MRLRLPLCALLLLALPSIGLAEELVPDTKYRGPVTLEVPSHGVSFRLPKGWLGFLSGDYFLVGAEAFDGFISMAAEKLTPKQALAEFRKTQALGDGFKMHPKGKPAAKGNVIQVDVEVTNGDQSNPGQLRAVIGKYGVGVVMGTVGVGQAFNRIQTVARAIEKSLILSKPAASSASPERIHGCWKHFSSSGGYGSSFTEAKLRIYPDGSYSYYSASSVSAAGQSVMSEDREEGPDGVHGNSIAFHPSRAKACSPIVSFDVGIMYVGSGKWIPSA